MVMIIHCFRKIKKFYNESIFKDYFKKQSNKSFNSKFESYCLI